MSPQSCHPLPTVCLGTRECPTDTWIPVCYCRSIRVSPNDHWWPEEHQRFWLTHQCQYQTHWPTIIFYCLCIIYHCLAFNCEWWHLIYLKYVFKWERVFSSEWCRSEDSSRWLQRRMTSCWSKWRRWRWRTPIWDKNLRTTPTISPNWRPRHQIWRFDLVLLCTDVILKNYCFYNLSSQCNNLYWIGLRQPIDKNR